MHLQGAQPISFAYALVYLVMAWVVARWNRGVLPVAAALAILFAVIAAVAGPAWFARDKAGFDNPALDPSLLGILTLSLVPVQLLLAAFAMSAFQQQWHVEVEVTPEEADRYYGGGMSGGQLTRPLRLRLLPGGGGGIGRLDGFKIHCPRGRVGSSPTRRTARRRRVAPSATDRGLARAQREPGVYLEHRP